MIKLLSKTLASVLVIDTILILVWLAVTLIRAIAQI
jgi:hypothetical protein